jgi:ketosteroid isomerase-like protein
LKKQALNLQQYQTSKINERLYSFTTSIGCIYHCYFFDFSTAFSDYPALASKVFGFNLELKFRPDEPVTIPLDKRIAATVTNILKAFLHEKENAVVYICDNSDNREKARFHKFYHWFKQFNDGSIVQLRGIIRAGNTNILNALLIHKDNPQLNDFIEAYEIITGIFTKPDDDELENMLNDEGW